MSQNLSRLLFEMLAPLLKHVRAVVGEQEINRQNHGTADIVA